MISLSFSRIFYEFTIFRGCLSSHSKWYFWKKTHSKLKKTHSNLEKTQSKLEKTLSNPEKNSQQTGKKLTANWKTHSNLEKTHSTHLLWDDRGPSFARIQYELTIFLTNSLREITINSLYYSQINYDFTIFFSNNFFKNSLWIHYLFREFTMISLSFSRTHY